MFIRDFAIICRETKEYDLGTLDTIKYLTFRVNAFLTLCKKMIAFLFLYSKPTCFILQSIFFFFCLYIIIKSLSQVWGQPMWMRAVKGGCHIWGHTCQVPVKLQGTGDGNVSFD